MYLEETEFLLIGIRFMLEEQCCLEYVECQRHLQLRHVNVNGWALHALAAWKRD
jgi:hypothetical protein